MFSKEFDDALIIYKSVKSEPVKRLLYQVQVNFDLMNFCREQMKSNMEELNFHNFAKSQSNHMNEGVFGAEKHKELQLKYSIKVLSLLITLITSGNRFITAIKLARKKEQKDDWLTLKSQINIIERKFDDRIRNFMEHLEEKTGMNIVPGDFDCYFTPGYKLICKEENYLVTFDFDENSLNSTNDLYNALIKMLKERT